MVEIDAARLALIPELSHVTAMMDVWLFYLFSLIIIIKH